MKDEMTTQFNACLGKNIRKTVDGAFDACELNAVVKLGKQLKAAYPEAFNKFVSGEYKQLADFLADCKPTGAVCASKAQSKHKCSSTKRKYKMQRWCICLTQD